MTTSPVMHWLTAGLPITLLCDLASVSDPDSTAINSVERPENDAIWQEAAVTLAARRHTASA
jgi:hypothetical protein